MKLKLLAALLFAAAPAAAQPPAAPPKLIVAIAVDQFSADLFAQYRRHFTGGFRRLSQGVVFPAGYQSHAATETCPGHATILTGARPARTGIIANDWIDLGVARRDTTIYCGEDERVPGSSSDDYTVSTLHLRVPTLGDLLRRADPRSRTVAVAGKDRAALMVGGHEPAQRWYRDERAFVTDRSTAPSGAVIAANRALTEALARPRAPDAPVPLCAPRGRPIAAGPNRTVGPGRFARAAGDLDGFIASPDYDAIVLALAAGLAEELQLGRRGATDLLAIGLSATDHVGHGYGPGGGEMCHQLVALDRLLGAFLERLDALGVDYAVALTADHGGLDIPERSRADGGLAAERSEPELTASRIGRRIGQDLGLSGDLLFGGRFGDVYLSRALSPADRARVLAEALRRYRDHAQVAAVFTREEIAATPIPSGPPDGWTLIQRARASFDAERSGDLLVLLRPRVTPIPEPSRSGSVATHGSPWDYDRRVPILFWRRGLTPFEQPLAVETVDIMPTLAALIGLPLAPGSIDGRCLDLIEGPESSCPAGR